MTSATAPDQCYCYARRRYEAVDLRLLKNGYRLTLTLVGGNGAIVGRNLTADEVLVQIEPGRHYLHLHATDPQIHRSVPSGDPVAAALLAVAALRSRVSG